MNLKRFAPLLLIMSLCGQVHAASDQPSGSVTSQVLEIQQKMLGDEQTLALILALQNDPEMQALLNDPALLEAVAAGDLTVLNANPKFMKLLDNAMVKEIQKRVGE